MTLPYWIENTDKTWIRDTINPYSTKYYKLQKNEENSPSYTDVFLANQGYKIYFDGSSHVEVPHNDALNMTNDITIEFWLTPDWTTKWTPFIGKDDGSSANYRMWIGDDYGVDVKMGTSSITPVYTASDELSSGDETHIALTVNSSDELKLYINGILKTTDTISIGATNSAPLLIGIDEENGTYGSGALRDIRIWNIERTQEEIVNNMYNRLKGDEVGLVVYYPVIEAEGLGVHKSYGFEDGTLSDWSTGGDADWFASENTSNSGSYCAESGNIGDNQSSWISIDAPSETGKLEFYWKVSSESNYDYLEFYINGSRKKRISGKSGWNKKTYSISPGDEIKFSYKKDGSVSNNNDCGYIDDVIFYKYYSMLEDFSVNELDGTIHNHTWQFPNQNTTTNVKTYFKDGWYLLSVNNDTSNVLKNELIPIPISDLNISSETESIEIIPYKIFNSFQGYPSIFQDCVAYWDFKGDANDIINDNNGSVNGATLTTDHLGFEDSAYYFDGSSYINCGNSSSINITSNFTIEALINTNSNLSKRACIVSKLTDGSDKQYALDVDTDGTLVFNYEQSANNYNAVSDSAIEFEEIQHVMFSMDESLNINFYIENQTAGATQASEETSTTTQPLIIGRWSGSYDDYYFNGTMYFIRIWNRVLTKSERDFLYKTAKQKYIYPKLRGERHA